MVRAELNEPQFANLVKLVKEDIHYTTCEEMRTRLMEVGMAIKTQLDGCPMANRLSRQVVTLLRFVKRAEKISDLPDMKKVERWWNRKNF